MEQERVIPGKTMSQCEQRHMGKQARESSEHDKPNREKGLSAGWRHTPWPCMPWEALGLVQEPHSEWSEVCEEKEGTTRQTSGTLITIESIQATTHTTNK